MAKPHDLMPNDVQAWEHGARCRVNGVTKTQSVKAFAKGDERWYSARAGWQDMDMFLSLAKIASEAQAMTTADVMGLYP